MIAFTISDMQINPTLEARLKKLEELSNLQKLLIPRRRNLSSSIHNEGYHSNGEEKSSVELDPRAMRRS